MCAYCMCAAPSARLLIHEHPSSWTSLLPIHIHQKCVLGPGNRLLENKNSTPKTHCLKNLSLANRPAANLAKNLSLVSEPVRS